MGTALAIIWDFDGTLAHRPGMWSQCLADLAGDFLGERFRREDFVPFCSKGFPWHEPERPHTHIRDAADWWNSLEPVFATAFAAATRISPADAQALAKRVRAYYTDAAGWSVFADVVPALERLSHFGWSHVMLSNHVPELPLIVSRLGLGSHFKAILTSAQLGYEKPRAECFAAARACVDGARRIVVVGDSPSADIAGARAVGLEAVLVRTAPRNGEAHCEGLESLVKHLHGI